jgi:hypothetical protein
MISRKQTLFSLGLLTLIIVGVFVVASVGQDPIGTEMKFIPRFLTTDNMATVRAEIMVYEGPEEELIRLEDEIDNTTVVLEGWLAPIDQWVEYKNDKPKQYIAVFSGSQVKSVVISKASHMGIIRPLPWNPVTIHLTVSGKLNDGRSWEASSTVKVMYSEIEGPNP